MQDHGLFQCSKPSPAPTRYYAKEQAAIDQLTAELSLVEPLQVAMDNGARRALVPLESKRDFLEVSADIVERVNPIFFSDPMTAAMKALGMT
jgi:ATP-dependent Lon protease